MKIITQILKSIIVEVFIIFIFILVINNYIGNVDERIKADAIGYYDYLPSLFIHHDLVRKNSPIQKDSTLYRRITTLGTLYVDYKGLKVNKCPVGTAVLELPFFTYTYLTTVRERNQHDGYQLPFQVTIYHAALFYLFLTIFFLKKTLELYDIRKYAIILAQLFLVLATAVTHYVNYDAGYSHVYSLFAITAFIYFTTYYFKNRTLNHFILACLFFGLVLILRQINLLIILFVPFLAGSIKNLKDGLLFLLANPKKLLIGILSTIGVFSFQSLLWYLQTGHFLIYSYQNESFDFTKPHFFDILFSYRKGLFVYTPILFISLFGLAWLAYKRKFYLVFTWLCFFIILSYVYSSWWVWFFGCSYGMRVFIDYYTVFFIPLALMFDGLAIKIKLLLIMFSFLTIPLNIIQTYQYKQYILHWIDMDKAKYWKVFLKTDDRFKGVIWKRVYDYNHYSNVKEISIGNITTSSNTDTTVYRINTLDIPDFDKVSIIQIVIDNEYNSRDETKIILGIKGANDHRNYYWYNPNLINFSERNFNEWQTGLFNYEFTPFTDPKEKAISLEVKSGHQATNLKNVRIKFLRYK
jgi:hypothetical protein